VAALLFQPRSSIVYVGPDSITINPVPPGLPFPLAELCFFYPATMFATAVLLVCGGWRKWNGSRGAAPARDLAVFFLPTYLAAFESTQLVAWSMRCHSITNPPPVADVIASGALLSAVALVSTIVLGASVARTFGRRSQMGLPVSAGALAAVTSVAIPWWILWVVATPLWGNLSLRAFVVLNAAPMAALAVLQLLRAGVQRYRALREPQG
jgi:hypothetical protein